MASINLTGFSGYPMMDYVTKLLVLEAVRCTQTEDEHGLFWIQQTLQYLAARWEVLKGPK